MNIPEHWAQARSQFKRRDKQITVKRFGWSNTSAAEAQAMAQARADEALLRIQAGELLGRSEKKTAYNGSEGVPIREEVLSRHGSTVITRNGYGAQCLNTPDVLIADMDFPTRPSKRWANGVKWAGFALLALSVAAGLLQGSKAVFGAGMLFTLLVSALLTSPAWRLAVRLRGGNEGMAERRIAGFLRSHPAWAIRQYRTPAGLRLIATHQRFDARSPEVQAFFTAIEADPVYVRMCLNQQCFRARLTAKPWRIAMPAPSRPRPGVWPVNPLHMAERQAWIKRYETQASGFAACHFVAALGTGFQHIDVMPVVELHDRETRAMQKHLAMA